MIKKTITYTDFNDKERTEDFYFNLTEAEILESIASIHDKGAEKNVIDEDKPIPDMIQDIIKAQSTLELINTFKELVLKAYGVKSADGRRFIKTEELATEFSQTKAYSKLFMDLANDADAAAKFVNGIIPN